MAVMVLTMDKFGRVLIPEKARQALRLAEGSEIELMIDEDTGTAELKPVRKEEDTPPYIKYTDWGWPYLDVDIQLPDNFDTVEFIKQTRQEYLDRKMGL